MSRDEQPYPLSESLDILMKIRLDNPDEQIWFYKMYKEMKTIDKLRFDPMMSMRILQETIHRYPVRCSYGYHSRSLQDRMIGKLWNLTRAVIEASLYGLCMNTSLQIEPYLVDYIANRVTLTEELVEQSPKQILQFICGHRRAEITELEHARRLSEDECVSNDA